MSPSSHFHCLFPQSGKAKQIHTWRTFDKFLFHNKPSLKSTSFYSHYFITKTPLKNITSVTRMANFTYVCVHWFSILVSNGPQKCSLVWSTSKHRVAHNAFCIMDIWISFLLLCLQWNSPWQPVPFPSMPSVSYVLCQVSFVGWSMGLVLLCVVICVWGSCPSPVLGPSPTHIWNNCQPQDATR